MQTPGAVTNLANAVYPGNPTPSMALSAMGGLAYPASKELATYIVDLIPSCMLAQHVSILRAGV